MSKLFFEKYLLASHIMVLLVLFACLHYVLLNKNKKADRYVFLCCLFFSDFNKFLLIILSCFLYQCCGYRHGSRGSLIFKWPSGSGWSLLYYKIQNVRNAYQFFFFGFIRFCFCLIVIDPSKKVFVVKEAIHNLLKSISKAAKKSGSVVRISIYGSSTERNIAEHY